MDVPRALLACLAVGALTAGVVALFDLSEPLRAWYGLKPENPTYYPAVELWWINVRTMAVPFVMAMAVVWSGHGFEREPMVLPPASDKRPVSLFGQVDSSPDSLAGRADEGVASWPRSGDSRAKGLADAPSPSSRLRWLTDAIVGLWASANVLFVAVALAAYGWPLLRLVGLHAALELVALAVSVAVYLGARWEGRLRSWRVVGCGACVVVLLWLAALLESHGPA